MKIKSKTFYFCKITATQAYGAIANWLDNCSKDPNYDWKDENSLVFDKSILQPLEYFYKNYTVRIINEIKCRIQEEFEVAEIADADLSPNEQFLSKIAILQNNLKF